MNRTSIAIEIEGVLPNLLLKVVGLRESETLLRKGRSIDSSSARRVLHPNPLFPAIPLHRPFLVNLLLTDRAGAVSALRRSLGSPSQIPDMSHWVRKHKLNKFLRLLSGVGLSKQVTTMTMTIMDLAGRPLGWSGSVVLCASSLC